MYIHTLERLLETGNSAQTTHTEKCNTKQIKYFFVHFTHLDCIKILVNTVLKSYPGKVFLSARSADIQSALLLPIKNFEPFDYTVKTIS